MEFLKGLLCLVGWLLQIAFLLAGIMVSDALFGGEAAIAFGLAALPLWALVVGAITEPTETVLLSEVEEEVEGYIFDSNGGITHSSMCVGASNVPLFFNGLST
jgi:hypothetical protein